MKRITRRSGGQGRDESSSDRVGVMLTIGGLGLGGAEIVVRDLARNLDPARFDVSICCTKGLGCDIDRELLEDGFDVFGLAEGDQEEVSYFSAPKLRRAIKDRKVDIVHTHGTAALLDAAPCRLVLPRTKLVHTFHYGNYPLDSWRHHVLERLCSRAVDRLVAVGFEQSKRIQRTYKLPSSRLDTIWNGVAVGSPPAQSSFRAEIGTDNRLLIGTIAKLIEQKGLDNLLAVARDCKDRNLPFQFVLVGDGPLRDELEQRKRELGLGDTVILAGWIHNAAQLVLPEFDVFFQPSRWEAMSIVILEAMAAGKAIVATKVGDNAHVLEDEKTGLLVDAGDIAGMTQTLTRLDDATLRSKLGNAAKQRFEEEFTIQRMVDRYEQLYEELLTART